MSSTTPKKETGAQESPSRQLFGSPSSVRSPKAFNTPTTKGRGEDIRGLLVAVGLKETSRKGNPYYLLSVQVTKSQLTVVTVMLDNKNPPRDTFTAICGQPMELLSVYPGDDGYFFSRGKGSSFRVIDGPLQFNADDITSTLMHVATKTSGNYHIKVMLKWVNRVETTKNGNRFRGAVVADVSGSFKLTIWKSEWWKALKEDSCYLITNLKLDEYFGYFLATTERSRIELEINVE